MASSSSCGVGGHAGEWNNVVRPMSPGGRMDKKALPIAAGLVLLVAVGVVPRAYAAPTELVTNGSLEAGGAIPTCFQAGGWGTHTVTQGISNDTPTGTGRSYRIQISNYASGDRKLMLAEQGTCAAAVEAGKVYSLSVAYKSTSANNAMTLFRKTATGWAYWTDVKRLPAAATWSTATAVTPAVPAGTVAVSMGVSIAANGVLLTDNYSIKTPDAPGTVEPPPAAGLALTGRWTTAAVQLPNRTVHSTLLRDGRVLLIAGSGNSVEQFNAGQLKTSVWNPVTNIFTDVPTPVDLFCAGHVTLADGRVLIQGGTKNYPNQGGVPNYGGLKNSYIFDPATNAYTRINDTIEGHWYPTLTKLENGNVWMAGGLRENSEGTVVTEMYDAAAGRWLGLNEVPQTWSYWGSYPHMYLMQDNRLFYAGAHTFGNNAGATGAAIYNWRTAQISDVTGLRSKDLRDQAGSVLLPPAQDQKVMIVGGGNTETNVPAIKQVDVIDLKAPTPVYTPGPDLPGTGKLYVNTVNLPDRTVLAANGATNNRAGNINSAAIYDPVANKWSQVAADPIGRNYHSSAQVLPDGRVVVLGSNPGDNSWELRISVYEPPYLFKGTRPTVTASPTTAAYGAKFSLGVTGNVVSASLLAPGSATHQTDTNARLVDLPITGTGTAREAQLPANKAILPPGPYMLTVKDANGSVSVASWITVR